MIAVWAHSRAEWVPKDSSLERPSIDKYGPCVYMTEGFLSTTMCHGPSSILSGSQHSFASHFRPATLSPIPCLIPHPHPNSRTKAALNAPDRPSSVQTGWAFLHDVSQDSSPPNLPLSPKVRPGVGTLRLPLGRIALMGQCNSAGLRQLGSAF